MPGREVCPFQGFEPRLQRVGVRHLPQGLLREPAPRNRPHSLSRGSPLPVTHELQGGENVHQVDLSAKDLSKQPFLRVVRAQLGKGPLEVCMVQRSLQRCGVVLPGTFPDGAAERERERVLPGCQSIRQVPHISFRRQLAELDLVQLADRKDGGEDVRRVCSGEPAPDKSEDVGDIPPVELDGNQPARARRRDGEQAGECRSGVRVDRRFNGDGR